MPDIALRGELWDNDSADVLRFWGWRDITAPMDIQAALEAAGGEDVTLLVNSPGGDMTVGLEIRSMLRRYQGRTTALFQGYGAIGGHSGGHRVPDHPERAGGPAVLPQPQRRGRGGLPGHAPVRGVPAQRPGLHPGGVHRPERGPEGIRSREELISLMDQDIWITPTQAREYGLIDEIVGGGGGGGGPGGLCGSSRAAASG